MRGTVNTFYRGSNPLNASGNMPLINITILFYKIWIRVFKNIDCYRTPPSKEAAQSPYLNVKI